MSKERLAELVRTDRQSIYLYESGKGNPQFKVIAEIASELKAEFNVLGCRIAASELLEPSKEEQLKLKFDQDHSFLANVKIRPTKWSLTIANSYGLRHQERVDTRTIYCQGCRGSKYYSILLDSYPISC